MPLIFRVGRTEPLTHEQLDDNFRYVHASPWEFKSYDLNKLVYIRDENANYTLYRCVHGHDAYAAYGTAGNAFTTTMWLDGAEITIWEPMSSNGVYNPDLPEDMEVPEDVGGISMGTTVAELKGKSFTEMFNRLLFPSITPNYVNPSTSLASTHTGLQVIGKTIDITLTAHDDRGLILQPWDGNTVQNYRAGAVLGHTFRHDNGLVGVEWTLDGSVVKSSVLVTKGLHNMTLATKFAQGPQPVDNYNNIAGSPYPETILNASQSYEGVYPIFATTVDNTQLTEQPLYSMISGNNIEFTLAPEVDANRQAFAVPQAWLDARPLQGVYYFNTVSNSYSNVNKITEFTTSVTSRTIEGVNVTYTRFEYNYLMRGAMKIKLVF